MKKDLINIENQDGNLVVNSREIAENFEKRHDHVLDAVRNIITENSGLIGKYFIESSYKAGTGKSYTEYLLTRDGFTLLAMGLTGKKALEWKLRYIEAFNRMESALKEVYHVSQTAIVNNVMEVLEERVLSSIDERLSKYEENYRPTHANKISINSYIKNGLGDSMEGGEVGLVKQRVLLMLDAEAWQDVP